MEGGAHADPLGLVGALIDGQFRVEEVAGRGAGSVVYRGRHEGIDAPIAIKCLLGGSTRGVREGARLDYQLGRRHVHIVQSLASGTTRAPATGASVAYVVREWLQGRSLAAELAKQRGRKRSLREVAALLGSAADALGFAHAQGVVHLRVSPSSLFVAWTDEGPLVKVLDFGEGRALRPAYAAPEQLDATLGSVGAATDVYAFARVVCEALAGEPVLPEGATEAQARKALSAPPSQALALLGADASSILARALAPAAADRPADLRALWADLTAALARAPKSIVPPPAPKRAPPRLPRAASRPAPPEFERAPDRASTTAEVAPAVSPPSEPSLLASPDVFAPPFEPSAGDARAVPSLVPAGLPTTAIAPGAWVARLGRTPKQQRLVAAVGAASLCAIALLLALTAPRAAPDREGRLTSARARKSVAVQAPAARAIAAPARMVLLPADVVPSSPPAALSPDPAAAPGPFSPDRARIALAAAAPDLTACATTPGPRGPGSVRVRFNPSGKMAEAYLGPPYASTATGRCILERFSHVRVDPFVGIPASLNYAFSTIPY